jgi:adenylate kinase family enzyme
MNRIAIVGATGSGKTTLARKVTQRLGVPHIETDSVYWGPNWTPIPLEAFRHSMDMATQDECWVIDGNYSKVRDLVWGRADTLLWLDYPLPMVFCRLLRRSIPRIFSREELWNGNYETFRGMFLSRDSLFVWLFQSYARQKNAYPRLVTEPMFSHLAFVRLKSQRKADEWLEQLPVKIHYSHEFI